MEKLIIAIIIIALAGYFFFQSKQKEQAAHENLQLGAEFLAKNKTQPGVIETGSGLQYLVLQPGTGSAKPSAKDTVTVHYHGTLIDGTVFDSSVERGKPLSFGLGQVISGWTQGLQLMVVGEKTRLFIPAKLAYGNRATGKVTPGSTLIFDVELLEIK
jgi:peptidylprolyl isomerase